MPIEYEVKFLIEAQNVLLDQSLSAQSLSQYYLVNETAKTIRLREYESHQKKKYELTLKFKRENGRPEFNLPLKQSEGKELLELLKEENVASLQKTRYLFQAIELGEESELFWEVDFFAGPLSFLAVAELEYPGPELPKGLEICPAWYQKKDGDSWPIDVSHNPDFINANLIRLKGKSLKQFKQKVEQLLKNAPL